MHQEVVGLNPGRLKLARVVSKQKEYGAHIDLPYKGRQPRPLIHVTTQGKGTAKFARISAESGYLVRLSRLERIPEDIIDAFHKVGETIKLNPGTIVIFKPNPQPNTDTSHIVTMHDFTTIGPKRGLLAV